MTNKLPVSIEIPEDFLNEEIRYDYFINKGMKEIWAVEIDLLVVLLNICKSYNLRIYADAGTMLGAVRHKGFIPWDDDIDMMMPRADYEKLCIIAPNELKPPYFFQTEYTDKGSLRGHAQIRNSSTTGILKKEIEYHYSFNQGIFIDIFPLDAAPDDEHELNLIQDNTTVLLRKAWHNSGYTSRYVPSGNILRRPIKRLVHDLLNSPIGDYTGFNCYYTKYETECKKYNTEVTKRVAKYYCTDESKRKQVWYRTWFDNVIMMPFEFTFIPIPCDYEKIMDVLYGNWRIPVKTPNVHGDVIFDVTKSYIQYFETLHVST